MIPEPEPIRISWFMSAKAFISIAQVDDVEMKDKDVEHPEDHHDQHEFLAQSRIVAPPYFESWWDVYIQKLDKRVWHGSCIIISSWW